MRRPFGLVVGVIAFLIAVGTAAADRRAPPWRLPLGASSVALGWFIGLGHTNSVREPARPGADYDWTYPFLGTFALGRWGYFAGGAGVDAGGWLTGGANHVFVASLLGAAADIGGRVRAELFLEGGAHFVAGFGANIIGPRSGGDRFAVLPHVGFRALLGARFGPSRYIALGLWVLGRGDVARTTAIVTNPPSGDDRTFEIGGLSLLVGLRAWFESPPADYGEAEARVPASGPIPRDLAPPRSDRPAPF